MSEEEKREIETNDVSKVVHRAHLRKADFDKYGYTDRCPGCSAILRGLHVQPHSIACRARMEKELQTDVGIKNAKVRLQERSARTGQAEMETDDSAKRKLDEIEARTLKEQNPEKLVEMFEEYRQ